MWCIFATFAINIIVAIVSRGPVALNVIKHHALIVIEFKCVNIAMRSFVNIAGLVIVVDIAERLHAFTAWTITVVAHVKIAVGVNVTDVGKMLSAIAYASAFNIARIERKTNANVVRCFVKNMPVLQIGALNAEIVLLGI